MKKLQFSVFAMMIMALVCVSFASCGGDDDDSSGGASSWDSDLLGTWIESERASNRTDYYGFLFESNGKGYYNEWDSKDIETPQDGARFTWSTADGILTIAMSGEKAETYKYVLSSDKRTLTLYDVSSGRTEYTLSKQ